MTTTTTLDLAVKELVLHGVDERDALRVDVDVFAVNRFVRVLGPATSDERGA